MAITEIGSSYYNNVYDSSYAAQKNDIKSQNENMQTDVKRMAEQPVKISISGEGKEYYRNSIRQNKQETYEDVLQRKEQLKKFSFTDYSYEIQKRAAQQNESADTKRSTLSTADKANSYVRAYAELYDEIILGYENGTREMYTADENGTHKLTKDEEINALDAAYMKTVDDFVEMEKTNQHAREIISEEMEKISKISPGSALASTYLEQQKTKSTDDIPENLNEKMYRAIISFKEQYAMFNPKEDELSQLLMSIEKI